MNNPEYVIIDNEEYKINTDFRVALECNKIAEDETIGDFERALAIIYTLFGDKGIEHTEHYEKLLKYAKKYLLCGEQEISKPKKEDKNDLDFSKCIGLIKSSFRFDYQYDPYKEKYLHWYDFNNDLMNLSTSEFGTCCVLNRIASILNQDLSQIKNDKERNALKEEQDELRKKYCINIKKKYTKEQQEIANKIYEAFGLRKE